MLRRRKPEDDDDNQDRWLLSYADLITLLFAFFVVMYATSTINLNKYRDVSHAVVTAFQGEPGRQATVIPTGEKPKSPTSVLTPLPLSHLYQEKKRRDQEKVHVLGQQIANALAPYIEQKTASVLEHAEGVDINLSTSLLFSDQQLTPSGKQLLALVASRLKAENRTLRVEAHSGATASESAAALWETTALQAARVTQQLVQSGLPATQLRAIGLADTRPASSSEHPLAQAANRRISLCLPAVESPAQQSQETSLYTEILPLTAERLQGQ